MCEAVLVVSILARVLPYTRHRLVNMIAALVDTLVPVAVIISYEVCDSWRMAVPIMREMASYLVPVADRKMVDVADDVVPFGKFYNHFRAAALLSPTRVVVGICPNYVASVEDGVELRFDLFNREL